MSGSNSESGLRAAVTDALAALLPLEIRDLETLVAAQLERIPSDLNEFGYDPFGMSPAAAKPALVALNKIDLVDAEMRELALMDIKEFLGTTGLGDMEVYPVSAETGEGVEELRAAIIEVVAVNRGNYDMT